jgi:hypothetical protein
MQFRAAGRQVAATLRLPSRSRLARIFQAASDHWSRRSKSSPSLTKRDSG